MAKKHCFGPILANIPKIVKRYLLILRLSMDQLVFKLRYISKAVRFPEVELVFHAMFSVMRRGTVLNSFVGIQLRAIF